MTSLKINSKHNIFDSLEKNISDIKKSNENDDNKIFMQQLNESDKNIIEKNSILKEKLKVVDQILDMYPLLKKDRLHIVDNILDKKIKKTNEYVLDKFIHNNKSYYRDTLGNIIDENVNLVGVYTFISNVYSYYFFTEIKKINIEDIYKINI
jgi:hypothetical protein